MQIPDIENLNNEETFDFDENAEKIRKLKIFPKKQQSPFITKWLKASKFTLFKSLFEKFLLNLDNIDCITMEEKEKIIEEKFKLISEMEKMGDFLKDKANLEHFLFLRSYGKIEENLYYHLDLKKEIENLANSTYNLEEELKKEKIKIENPENNENILASVNSKKEEIMKLSEQQKELEIFFEKTKNIQIQKSQELNQHSKTYQEKIDRYNAEEITEAQLKGKSEHINELQVKKNELLKINEELKKEFDLTKNKSIDLSREIKNLNEKIQELKKDIKQREDNIIEQKAISSQYGLDYNKIEIDLFIQGKQIKEKEDLLTELTKEKDDLLMIFKDYDKRKIEKLVEKKEVDGLNLEKIYSLGKEIDVTQEMKIHYYKILQLNARKEAEIPEKTKEIEKLLENLSNAKKRNCLVKKKTDFMWRRILFVILLTVLMVFLYKI